MVVNKHIENKYSARHTQEIKKSIRSLVKIKKEGRIAVLLEIGPHKHSRSFTVRPFGDREISNYVCKFLKKNIKVLRRDVK